MAFPNAGKFDVVVGMSEETLLDETVTEIVEDDDADGRPDGRDEISTLVESRDDTTIVVSSGAAGRSISGEEDKDEDDKDEDEEGRTCRAEGSYPTRCSRKCARSVDAGQAYLAELGMPARNPANEPITKLNNPRKMGFLGNFLTCCMCVFISYYYTTKLHKYQ